jgi:hypothetical protein
LDFGFENTQIGVEKNPKSKIQNLKSKIIPASDFVTREILWPMVEKL